MAKMIADGKKIVWSFQCFMSINTFGDYDAMPDFFTHEQKLKGVAVGKGARNAAKLMKKHGVFTIGGADMFGIPFKDMIKQDITCNVDAGYTPAEALKHWTGNAGIVLKWSGPLDPYPTYEIGTIKAGAYADMLLWDGNPLEDIKLILDEDKLRLIMKDGKIYKNTLPTAREASRDEDADTIRARLTIDGRIAIYGVQFKTDSAELIEGSDRTIGVIASVLKANPDVKIAVVGHTDARGSHEHNLELSKLRADTVVAALINSHGIAGDRLFAAGASFLSPIAANDNEEGRALNRRVELVRVQ
jgi:outer membrane protein OmpA-like peptidoglycan-associated protein